MRTRFFATDVVTGMVVLADIVVVAARGAMGAVVIGAVVV